MKKTMIENITKLSSKMPKTLNEALNFNDAAPYEEEGIDLDNGEGIQGEPEQEIGIQQPMVNPASEKAKKLIDDIRKMSLKAMAELADTPEDENYLMLKKVWSMTDRKPEQDKNNAQN